jgi:outer membrane protein assembly factor BamB
MNKPTSLRSLLAVGFVTLSLSHAGVRADDWPQWQGPKRDSVSKETGLLKEWPKEGPPLAWKVSTLGGGYNAPSVAEGRIYGMSHRGGEEVAWALNEKDGKELWATNLGPAHAQDGMPQGKEGPGCTPTVDGERMYVLGLGGNLSCLQVADGKVVWQKSLTKDFGGQIPTWSYRESPLVDGEKVIVTPGGDDATIVALNKSTGETVWKSKVPDAPAAAGAPAGGPPGRGQGGPPGRGQGRPGGPRGGGGARGGMGRSGAAYASAIAIDFDGQRQYVQLTAKSLVGVSASDGRVLWHYDKPANGAGINCSTPLYHDGMIFASSAYGAGGGAVKLGILPGGGLVAQEVYFTKKLANHHGGYVVFDGCLYGAHGGNEGGNIVCLDFKTGNELWNERQERRAAKGSIALADGRLYYRVEDGTMLLIEPSKTEYLERGRFEQPDRTRSPAWAHPVIANGKLYIRDQDVLLCYDIKAK